MSMPVYSPAEINLRIVHVKNRHILQPDGAVNLPNGRSQSAFTLDVVSGGKKVRRVQACPGRQVSQPCQNLSDFFQPSPNRRTHSRSVLDQDSLSTHRRAL